MGMPPGHDHAGHRPREGRDHSAHVHHDSAHGHAGGDGEGKATHGQAIPTDGVGVTDPLTAAGHDSAAHDGHGEHTGHDGGHDAHAGHAGHDAHAGHGEHGG